MEYNKTAGLPEAPHEMISVQTWVKTDACDTGFNVGRGARSNDAVFGNLIMVTATEELDADRAKGARVIMTVENIDY